MAYAVSYSILITIIPHQHIDMRNHTSPYLGWKGVCWEGIPNFIQLRTGHGKIYEISLTIGHTPLVRLDRIGNGRILAKIESRNPSFSVKCRIGANMIWDAESVLAC